MWDHILKQLNHNIVPHKAISLWSGDKDSLQLVSEGINIVYRFEKNNEIYYLRLTHEKLRSEDELHAAIAFCKYLFDKNVSVCEPIQSISNYWIEIINDNNENYLAHVCREVRGLEINFDKDSQLYFNWGKALAQFHQASSQYQPGQHQYTSWKSSLDELSEYIKKENGVVQSVYAAVFNFFNDKKITKQNFGLTHGDHREGNVLASGTKVGIIDFDLPSMNWFMEDFCRPFFHSIVHNETAWQHVFSQYVDGYFSIMPKDSINLDIKSFVRQIQFKCLEIYIWTKNNWQGEIGPGGLDVKAWLKVIHHKILHEDEITKVIASVLNKQA